MKPFTTYSKLYLTEGSGSNDLIRFRGSVHNVKNGSNQISSQAAYVLADNGASEVYMSTDMANKLKAQGAVTRDAGWMEVKTARQQEHQGVERRELIHATVSIQDYKYTGWFTIFNLDHYDIILGKA